MRRSVLSVAIYTVAAISSVAIASDLLSWRQPDGSEVGGTVMLCALASGNAAQPCGGADNPLVSSPPVPTWSAVAGGTIATANTYQVLVPAGGALHGAYLVNTSPATYAGEPLWIDVTGTTGSQLSIAAMPIYPAPSASTPPGAWRIPPTPGAITIYGPAGASFRGFSG